MPRSKAAIATLKGFLRGELKGVPDSGDVVFAKGVKAALEWLTDSERPCPYAELEGDMGDDGGWEEAQVVEANNSRVVNMVKHQLALDAVNPELGNDPYAALPPTKLNTEAVSALLDASGQPIAIPNIDTSGIGNNTKFALPGSYEAAAREHPWLRQVGEDLASLHKGTPSTDRNTVVVGGGLGDEPLLSMDGGYDE